MMLRERLFGQKGGPSRATGKYIEIRMDQVLVFDERREFTASLSGPKARIDYNEAAGVIIDKAARKLLVFSKYVSGEMHIEGKKPFTVVRTPQWSVLITAEG